MRKRIPMLVLVALPLLIWTLLSFHVLGAPSSSSADTSAFARRWNAVPPQSWWRESAPYSCAAVEKTSSPLIEAGLQDLGGSDPLSLIRYYGNGSYLRYGYQSFDGCTPMVRYPDRTHLDPLADPTYYTLGDLGIWMDIARFPPGYPALGL